MTTFRIQCLLGYLGYLDRLEQDGISGPKTKNALRRFQEDYGLPQSGAPDEATGKLLLDAVAGRAEKVARPVDTGTWRDGIKHFKREEFRCKCGGRYCNGYPAEMQDAAVRIADAARAHFGRPAHVVSGLRCEKWNAHEGGVSNSQHMYGEAIDLRIDGVDSESLRQFVAKQPGHRYSYRINSTNVHFDIPVGNR